MERMAALLDSTVSPPPSSLSPTANEPPRHQNHLSDVPENFAVRSGSEGRSGDAVERGTSQGSEETTTGFGPGAGSGGNTAGPPPTTSVIPRKRSSVENIDYPRRRATIACEVCRSRKSRCDGTRPKCRLCIELNAECIYREPGIKLDAGDKLILEHLMRIESLLTAQHLPPPPPPAPIMPAPTTPLTPFLRSASTPLSLKSPAPIGLGSGMDLAQAMTYGTLSHMPKFHSTPALHLLQWPKISTLVSRPYTPHHLLQLELSRPPLQLNPNPPLDLSNAQAYITAYFERVNPWYALINPYTWNTYYRTALSQGFRSGAESCIVLLVLALGCASTQGSISRAPRGVDPPGISYFSAAWSIIPHLLTQTTMASAQSMILASTYLFYIVRPLEAWNLVSATATKIQLLISVGGAEKELAERVFWNAVLFESDLLAEMELPHSGLPHLEDTVGLPLGFEDINSVETPSTPGSPLSQHQPQHRDDLWYFLSEIALRRLLNRVSNLIYSRGTDHTIASLGPVVAELEFQLEQWYESLPLPVRFPMNHTLLAERNPVQTVLRLRYYACRTIIFRPYILIVLGEEEHGSRANFEAFWEREHGVREGCRKCLEACLRQLENITEHHAGHMPYLWQGALSMVSQSLLVMGATMCPPLAALLPEEEVMGRMFESVIREVEWYESLAPSLAMGKEILLEAEEKRRAWIRRRR